MILQEITQELLYSAEIQESEQLKEVCLSVVNMYPHASPPIPWAGYLVKEEGIIVGTCAYKGPPVSGVVEIAYFTFPGHEGRGVATRMAQRLIDLAIVSGAITIMAQTLPEKNASGRILEKLGFIFSGVVMHPEDGEVWEWQRTVAV